MTVDAPVLVIRMTARYALYFAPRPDEALAAFGNHWLGRDPERDIDLVQPDYDGLSREFLAAITGEPRRYGFHGTLKAPFRLAQGETADGLLAFAGEFARRRAPLVIGALQLRSLDGFLALCPVVPVPALDRLAADSVRDFDRFRAPPEDAELVRRRAAGLSPRQEALLRRWGYPYVLEEFRFHLTLTGRLETAEREHVHRLLSPLVSSFCDTPVPVPDLAVFVEDAPGAPFRTCARFPFAATL